MAFSGSRRCFIFFVLLLLSCFSVPSSAKGQPFYSIYSFGDADYSVSSLLDVPTPPPFTQEDVVFESGLSFMTPGATLMKPFFFLMNGIPLPPQQQSPSQINTFMKLFYKDCFTYHDCGRNKVLHNALMFMDQLGFNDYKHAFLNGKSIMEVSKLVPEVVGQIKNDIERLINDAGAKHFLVSGILPMGCLHGFKTMFPAVSSNYKCYEGLNVFTRLHNDHLGQALWELRSKYPQVDIVYADYDKVFMDAFLGFN